MNWTIGLYIIFTRFRIGLPPTPFSSLHLPQTHLQLLAFFFEVGDVLVAYPKLLLRLRPEFCVKKLVFDIKSPKVSGANFLPCVFVVERGAFWS